MKNNFLLPKATKYNAIINWKCCWEHRLWKLWLYKLKPTSGLTGSSSGYPWNDSFDETLHWLLLILKSRAKELFSKPLSTDEGRVFGFHDRMDVGPFKLLDTALRNWVTAPKKRIKSSLWRPLRYQLCVLLYPFKNSSEELRKGKKPFPRLSVFTELLHGGMCEGVCSIVDANGSKNQKVVL